MLRTDRLLVVAAALLIFSCEAQKKTREISGLFPVEQAGRGGYVNAEGTVVITPQFEKAGDFSLGLAVVKLGGRWGYINTEGKIVINPQFDGAADFSEDLAAVRIGSKYGYVDADGKIVIIPQRSACEAYRFPPTSYGTHDVTRG